MTRLPKIIGITFALVLLFLIMTPLLTPLLVRPNIAAYSIRNYNTSPPVDMSSWFNREQGQLFSNKIVLTLLPANFGFSPSGIFSFRQDVQKTVEFGVYYSKLIEFNDTNGNKVLDVGESFRNVSLDEFTWAYQKLNLSSGEVILPLIGVKQSISIVFIFHLYLETKNVTLSEEYSYIRFIAPGEFSVKTFVMISGFGWTQDNGSLPIGRRMLALELVLKSEVMPWNQKHWFQLANGSRVNNTHTMNKTEPIPQIPDMFESRISLINMENVTHGELRWFNKAIADGELKDLTASFITNGTTFNLYLSVPYYGSNILFLDPLFSMQNAPSNDGQVTPLLILFIFQYYYMSSRGLSPLPFLVVLIIALVIVAVYYLRRKRLQIFS